MYIKTNQYFHSNSQLMLCVSQRWQIKWNKEKTTVNKWRLSKQFTLTTMYFFLLEKGFDIFENISNIK